MTMVFTVTVRGEVSAEVEASDMGIDLSETSANELFDVHSSDVEFSDLQVSGTVTMEASVEVAAIEVEAGDIVDFDADTALDERLFPYGGGSVSSATFEITDSPSGFLLVSEAVGEDTARDVYSVLAASGYEVV